MAGMGNLSGQNIGRYTIIEELGLGGMASVYRAYDTRLECDVAVKIIRRDAFPAQLFDQVLERFHREARALAQLTHPNIVKVIDFGELEGTPYLVMPYLPGGTLKEHCGQPVPYREAVRLILPVARALEYAHRRGVLHRDVKPSNILMTETGEPLLGDFGIAKLLEPGDGRTLTGTGVGIGTPEYMAPEQGMGDKVDGRADVYALGVLLYELVTGRRPYTADTPMAVILKHINDPLPLPRAFVPGLPEAAEWVIVKALAKKPDDRYPDMAAFAAALEKTSLAQAGEPVLLEKPREAPHPVYIPPQPVEPRAEEGRNTLHLRRRPFPLRRTLLWGCGSLILVVSVLVGIAWLAGHPEAIAPRSATQTATLFSPAANFTSTTLSTPATSAPTLTQTPEPTLTFTPAPVAISLANAGGLRALARISKGTVENVAYAPGGQTLAVASSLGVYLYRAEDFTLLRLIETRGRVDDFAFSPDGALLVTDSADFSLKVWKTADGSPVRTLEGHLGEITCVAFSPDGQFLVSCSMDKTVRLWQVADGKQARMLVGHKDGVVSAAISPNNQVIATGSKDNDLRLWRAKDGQFIRTVQGHKDDVTSLAFSPDGKLLASGSADGTVRLWQADGRTVRALKAHTGTLGVESVAFSPDGLLLASGSQDAVVRLSWVADGSLFHTLEGHRGHIRGVAFSPDGLALVSGAGDHTVRLWRVANGSLTRTLEGHTGLIYDIAFSPDGALLATGSEENKLQLWRVADGSLAQALVGHSGYIASVAFSPDGRLLASAGYDSVVRLWSPLTGSLVRGLEEDSKEQAYPVRRIAFSADGLLLASGGEDGIVRLWRVSDGKLVRRLDGHTRGIESLAFSPDGVLLATGSADSTVRVWRVADGSLVRALQGLPWPVESLAFSPDSTLLAGGATGGMLRAWQVADGRLVYAVEGNGSTVESLDFSPDGALLAGGLWDGKVFLWRAADGALVHTLDGHVHPVYSVTFSPDGALLASGSEDGTVALWGVP